MANCTTGSLTRVGSPFKTWGGEREREREASEDMLEESDLTMSDFVHISGTAHYRFPLFREQSLTLSDHENREWSFFHLRAQKPQSAACRFTTVRSYDKVTRHFHPPPRPATGERVLSRRPWYFSGGRGLKISARSIDSRTLFGGRYSVYKGVCAHIQEILWKCPLLYHNRFSGVDKPAG